MKLPLFQPTTFKAASHPAHATPFGERGDGRIYVFDDRTVFAVQAAQVTRRPLLLRGPAGSGKSSLAPFIAHTLGCPFLMFSVTARTQARDLMWEFDALARLNDANVSAVDDLAKKRVQSLFNYIIPGKLWWAFDQASAALRGAPSTTALTPRNQADVGSETPNSAIDFAAGAVLLVDEIDKADPDVPNNLLEALGSRQFTVQETGTIVEDRQQPLVIITTNDERELPQAFQRRCITLQLPEKSVGDLVNIAIQHFADDPDLEALAQLHYGGAKRTFFELVALTLDRFRREARKRGERPPSTAEYLDTLAACIELGVAPAEPSLPAPATTPSHSVAALTPETTDASLNLRRWQFAIEVALSKRSSEPPPGQPA
jgi:MoxR-like ATPase